MGIESQTYQPLHPFPSSPDAAKIASRRLRHISLATFGIILTLVWTIWAITIHSSRRPPPLWRHGRNQRAWIRSVSDVHAGLGSVISQHRMAAVLADMFNSTLVVSRAPTGHDYSVSDWINRLMEEPGNLSNPCLVSGLQWTGTMEENVQRWCQDRTPPKMEKNYLSDVSLCTSFIDDRPWDYRMDLAACSIDWLDTILNFPPPPTPTLPLLKIALHIRWGDTAGQIGFDSPVKDDPDARTIRSSTAIRLVNRLRTCIPTSEVHVFKEGANDLGDLGVIAGAVLHSSSDVMADLEQISTSDIRITALGGYAEMIHCAAKHGLSVVVPNGFTPQGYAAIPRINVVDFDDVIEERVSCETLIEMATSKEKLDSTMRCEKKGAKEVKNSSFCLNAL